MKLVLEDDINDEYVSQCCGEAVRDVYIEVGKWWMEACICVKCEQECLIKTKDGEWRTE